MENKIFCPSCGKCHYRINSMSSTLVCKVFTVKDNEIEDTTDANDIIKECTCLECNMPFEIIFKSNGECKVIPTINFETNTDETSYNCLSHNLNPYMLGKEVDHFNNLYINCKEIHLVKDSLEIKLTKDELKDFKKIIIGDRTYVLEDKDEIH